MLCRYAVIMLNVVLLSGNILSVYCYTLHMANFTKCHYADSCITDCHCTKCSYAESVYANFPYAKCIIRSDTKLTVIMLSVMVLSVIMPIVVMVNAVMLSIHMSNSEGYCANCHHVECYYS
jgi:hypothetical protein